MSDLGTKEKILKTAQQLFGKKGYDSVSVREISKEADVNISAINYHFENKENLFLEVINSNREEMRRQMRSLYEKNPGCDTVQLTMGMLDFFLENAEALRLAFKMAVLDSHLIRHKPNEEDDLIGPPGGKVMFDCMMREVPNAKEEDVIWAVRTIFVQVVHKSLIVCNECIQAKCLPGWNIEEVRKSLSRLVRVVMSDL